MALLEKQLFVKTSKLPNSGKGLFTKKFIPKGTRIVEYKGRISAWKDVKDEDGKNGYIFYVTRNHVIDAQLTKSALSRYANDARGLSKITGVINNCDYITDGVKAYIESKKDIPAGSEIFVDYGKDYWKVIRENIKLREQDAKEEAKAKDEKRHVNGKKLNGTKVNGQHVASRKVNGTKKSRADSGVKKLARKK
jgi:SET domain-containing protein